jgi:hypothetical protein
MMDNIFPRRLMLLDLLRIYFAFYGLLQDERPYVKYGISDIYMKKRDVGISPSSLSLALSLSLSLSLPSHAEVEL